MFRNRAGNQNPMAAIIREVEGLRLQDRDTVALRYQSELETIEKNTKEANIAFESARQAIRAQSAEYTLNENLVEAALEACAVGDLGPIQAAKRRGGQTWELFCQSYPLQIAIRLRHPEIFKFLLENHIQF